MIATVTLSPALDKTVVIPAFTVGKVNRIRNIRLDAGGKGINVSKVLKMLGTDSIATGVLGGNTGTWIERELERYDIGSDFVHIDSETRTNLKIIDDILHTNTDINEPGAAVNAEIIEAVYQKIVQNTVSGDIAVFAGKAPEGVPSSVFGDLIQRLKVRGIHCYLDADAELLIHGAAALPDMVKPNEEELARLTGHELHSVEDIIRAALHLNDSGIRTVVVSLGAHGAIFVRDQKMYHAPGMNVPVSSTVGAGDSMMAAFCHGDSHGLSFEETCRLSIAVSAAEVMQSGTQPPAYDTVFQLLPQVKLLPVNP
ncbi:MAG: 1-phosphofructokinase [Clostridia bacterium]|nr:1-phosphofructokinase [Clostridia bacterium]